MLGGAVASEQLTTEEDAHFRHHGSTVGMVCGGQFDAGHEVLLAVCAELADGQLAAGENHGLGQVLTHERQGRGGEGHRIRAVEDDETVIHVVVAGDDADQFRPK